MVAPRRWRMALLVVLLLSGGSATLHAHQGPCHRRHSCPSDGHTYVCGDRGRCDQCPDNPYCQAGKPRLAAQQTPVPTPSPATQGEETACATVPVCFTPSQDCTAKIVQAIGHAQTSILLQAYSFMSAPIAKALVEAHKRGVHVEAILDQSNRTDKYSAADFLANQGIATRIDAQHAIAHNKVIIIDGTIVIGGSFNYTKAAQEKNAEKVLIIRDQALAAQDTQNWQAHAQHSQPYVGRGVRP